MYILINYLYFDYWDLFRLEVHIPNKDQEVYLANLLKIKPYTFRWKDYSMKLIFIKYFYEGKNDLNDNLLLKWWEKS